MAKSRAALDSRPFCSCEFYYYFRKGSRESHHWIVPVQKKQTKGSTSALQSEVFNAITNHLLNIKVLGHIRRERAKKFEQVQSNTYGAVLQYCLDNKVDENALISSSNDTSLRHNVLLVDYEVNVERRVRTSLLISHVPIKVLLVEGVWKSTRKGDGGGTRFYENALSRHGGMTPF